MKTPFPEPQPTSPPIDPVEPPSTLYALLIGINEYRADLLLTGQVRFPALQGCVQDTANVKAYLEQDRSRPTKISWLTNEQACKAAVVRGFTEHLGQAKAGDVVLFYFSGHGTQEVADPAIWTSETDGLLECIVCYYDAQTTDDFLLADKELRYLIRQVAKNQPHIVMIFDCCHSGDNTRDGELVTAAFANTLERRIPFSFPTRDWNKFVFSPAITAETIKQQGVAALLPEGTHVQLSACEADELAMEVGGAGVFTKTLLNVLQKSGGVVSYHSLRSRVRQYLRNVFLQKPRIYVANGVASASDDDSLLFSNFLNRPGQPGIRTTGEVIFNPGAGQTGGWLLNLGAIHGLTKQTPTFGVADPRNPQKTYQASVAAVRVDNALLVFATEAPPDTTAVYLATLDGLMMKPLSVNVQNVDGSLTEQQQLMDTLMAQTAGSIVTVDEEEQAAYVVRNQGGWYYMTYPADPYRPLTVPVRAGSGQAVAQLADQLGHIALWEFRKTLVNTEKSDLPDNPLVVEFFQVGPANTPTPMAVDAGVVAVRYSQQPDGSWATTLQIKLTNGTKQKLYVAVLYLSSTFESFPGFLKPTTYPLGPQESVLLSLDGNSSFTIPLPEFVSLYQWPVRTEYFKLIVSTDEFDAEDLVLPTLPDPPMPGDGPTESGHRSMMTTASKEVVLQGWTTQLYTLSFINPIPNAVDSARVQAMRNNPVTALFANGLYGVDQ